MKTNLILITTILLLTTQKNIAKIDEEFVRRRGVQLTLNGRPFYGNGFNAYWLMYEACQPYGRDKVTNAFLEASGHGLTIARTWAFSDGGYSPLQVSPGIYNENMFQSLDFVVSEAKKHGIKLILSLVDNYNDYGGKRQYVEWAKSQGQSLSSVDDFFTNPLVKSFYKNHIQKVLTRVNTITGVAYKDDPTIMAWELMNEPRCTSDPSGKTLQAWITEMAAYLKSIDSHHLLEIGLEGFYGPSTPDKQRRVNPNYLQEGTDFITNNQLPHIDFATVHSYPDQWLNYANDESQLSFLKQWVNQHIEDAQNILRKPVLFAEFGKSYKVSNHAFSSDRNEVYNIIYSAIYSSALKGGAAGGGLFWQLLTEGEDNFRDGYEIVLREDPSLAGLISKQSQRMSMVNKRGRIIRKLRN